MLTLSTTWFYSLFFKDKHIKHYAKLTRIIVRSMEYSQKGVGVGTGIGLQSAEEAFAVAVGENLRRVRRQESHACSAIESRFLALPNPR